MDNLIQREAERVAELLRTEIKDPITTITYHEFRTRVLPVLQQIGEGFQINQWVQITGHPFVRLNVLDETGAVKYSIPPILQPQNTSTDHDVHMADITTELQAARADSPAYANRMVLKMLRSLSDKDYDGEADAKEMAQVLNQIFKDHGLPLPFPTVTPTQTDDALPPPPAEVIIDGYDEL